MVKPLTFKGDAKSSKKKRKHRSDDAEAQTPRVVNDAENPEDDDSWVSAEAASDLAGPVIVVLPSDPPTCIACDANGVVFASPLENIVEANPATAEPHDVRQVWIASRIAGTESVSLKGHHGRYLAADKFGVLAATRDAISPEEQLACLPSSDTPGTFNIQTVRDTFVAVGDGAKGPEIRADAEEISFTTTVRIRMQARFKPRLRANKETKAREKISRRELETAVGRTLDEDEVRRLKKARRDGDYHEALLDVKVKGKHDKFA